jgi:hypothetical protein
VPGFCAGIGHAPGTHGVQAAESTRQVTDRLLVGSSVSATVMVAVVVEVRVYAGTLSVAVGAASVWYRPDDSALRRRGSPSSRAATTSALAQPDSFPLIKPQTSPNGAARTNPIPT